MNIQIIISLRKQLLRSTYSLDSAGKTKLAEGYCMGQGELQLELQLILMILTVSKVQTMERLKLNQLTSILLRGRCLWPKLSIKID